MKSFRDIHIKTKLVFIMVSVAGLSLLLALGFDILRDYNTHKNETFERVKVETNLVAEYCIAPLVFSSIEGLEEVLSKLGSSPDFISVAIYDTTHTLIASFQRDTDAQQPPLLEIHEDLGLYTHNNIIHITLPIKYDNIQYGVIYTHYSIKSLSNYIIENLFVSIAIIILLIVLSYFLALRLQRLISKPILTLSETMQNISQNNDYTIQLQKQGKDEIGNLYDSFNNMIMQIKMRQEERDKAQEAQRQYEHIVSSSTDMLALLDTRYNYLAANGAYTKAFKLTHEQLMGNTVTKVFGKEFFNTVIKPMADRCMSGEEVKYQDWFDFPAYKRRRYMEISYYSYYSKDEKIRGFVVNGRNITKRKRMEDELKKHRDHLEEMVKEGTANLKDKNKELEDKNEELERYNRLFENREFRIKELKDEIVKLKKR